MGTGLAHGGEQRWRHSCAHVAPLTNLDALTSLASRCTQAPEVNVSSKRGVDVVRKSVCIPLSAVANDGLESPCCDVEEL